MCRKCTPLPRNAKRTKVQRLCSFYKQEFGALWTPLPGAGLLHISNHDNLTVLFVLLFQREPERS